MEAKYTALPYCLATIAIRQLWWSRSVTFIIVLQFDLDDAKVSNAQVSD